MSQLEYLIALISIIVGLGLTDLARSFRDLVRPGRPVEWHWLPLAWAAIVFMLVVQLWWETFGALQKDLFADAIAFLPYLLIFLVLYLACSFALPDPTWEAPTAPAWDAASSDDVLDLEVFYFSASHRRSFFGMLMTLLILGQIISLVFPLLLEGSPTSSLLQRGLNFGINLVVAAVLASLIVTDRWWVHAIVTVFTFGGVTTTLIVGVSSLG